MPKVWHHLVITKISKYRCAEFRSRRCGRLGTSVLVEAWLDPLIVHSHFANNKWIPAEMDPALWRHGLAIDLILPPTVAHQGQA